MTNGWHWADRTRIVLVSAFLTVPAAAASPTTIEHGVWEGSAGCQGGPQHYRLSIEPGDRSNRFVLDLLDSPGGVAWAQAIGPVGSHRTSIVVHPRHHWQVRPFDEPPWPVRLNVSENSGILTSAAFGTCNGVSLAPVSKAEQTGGITAADQLPASLVGTLGCDGNRPHQRVALTLSAHGEKSVQGTLALTAHPDGIASDGGTFEIFGEFDPATGSLTLVGDRWIKKPVGRAQTFDFAGVLRDGGRRLAARATLPTCGLLDLAVPGTRPVDRITRPLTPRPILDWTDAGSCATFVEWASQAVSQIGGTSFYKGISVGEARKVAVGLFANHRFDPYFGKSFEDLTAEEKKHITSLGQYCTRLHGFTTPMRHSGADMFITDFFPGQWPELTLSATRFRLLRSRLDDETARLEDRTVGEADIPELEQRLGELDNRFKELWDEDLARARSVITGKLDSARGHFAARIERDIEALPDDWKAFDREGAVNADIARLGQRQRSEQDRLSRLLNARLAAVADTLLLRLADDAKSLEPTLTGLYTFRSRVDAVWPRLAKHSSGTGNGVTALNGISATLATAAFPAFERRVASMMSDATDFAEREARYRDVVSLYQSAVPADPARSAPFGRYAELVRSHAPVPTRADVVAADGGPTALGIKLALSDWMPKVWSATSAFFPPGLRYGFLHLTGSIRVAGIRRIGCRAAKEGGHWCDFDLRLDGRFPFLPLMSLVPGSARFVLNGDVWEIVETPDGPTSHYENVQRIVERSAEEWGRIAPSWSREPP